MQFNHVKAKMLRGEPSIGAAICFPSPELIEFCGWLGFEWIFLDAEHGPIGWAECQAMARACDARGLPSILRVPKLDRSMIAKYLETGVMGVAVPHINTAEQAEMAVRSARYAPVGWRGCDDGSSRSSAYGLTESASDYFAHSNREIMVVLWVEEVEGFKNLDDILQVPGVDAICFGPGDLALSLGLPGRTDHPDVQTTLADGRKKVLAAGKALIGETSTMASAKQALADGALLISTSAMGLLGGAGRAYLRELREHLAR